MKDFEFYIDKDSVKRQSKDLNLAKATARESLDRINMARSILSTQKPKYILENAYEAVREFIDAILYSEGFKSYSHEASVAYLSKLGFNVSKINDIDRLRRLRNNIKYYGGDATLEEAKEALKIAEDMIKQLKEKKKF